MRPALSLDSGTLQGALTDRGKMSLLVADYRSAVPHAAVADVVEALSTAYCRTLAEDPIRK